MFAAVAAVYDAADITVKGRSHLTQQTVSIARIAEPVAIRGHYSLIY